jgi:two-component system chemotaxis sensor kinase CheA
MERRVLPAEEGPVTELDEIVQEFLVESHENLDQLDRDLVALEQEPGSRDLLASVFRTLHTIKGTSGFLAFGHLEAVTHVGESLLSKLRDGELRLTPEITSALLEMVDAVRALLGSIEATGAEGEPDHTALIATLSALAAGTAGAPGATGSPTDEDPEPEPAPEPDSDSAPAPESARRKKRGSGQRRRAPRKSVAATEEGTAAATDENDATGEHREDREEQPKPLLGDVLVEHGSARPEDVAIAVLEQAIGDKRRLGEILVDAGAVAPQDVTEALEAQSGARRSVAESSIRVDVELLDTLMTLVGELVLTRNQIVQKAAARQDGDLLRTTHRLNLIAGELQEGVMKTRMQPIDNVWSKLPRVVRDLSVSLGKSVRVQMEGRDTELDKTILEAVKDPLTHLVRNAVDHGLETSEERTAKGKPAEGTLLLRAFHEGGQVNIEITDDGAGIDPVKVRSTAVARGLLTTEAAARLPDRDVVGLIFQPGFSTAQSVTNVSGRGVGMDVVKTNIEKIGGVIDVHSVVDEGTTVRIKIPLTLAIIPALIVTAAGNRYAIPQVNLLELVRLDGEQATSRIETIQGTPVYRLRGHLLPLVSLRAQLGLPEPEGAANTWYIVVLQADDRQFGLVVDDINDTEEIVVKPLGKQLRAIPLYAGATIMGDGRVALILDALAIAHGAHVLSDTGTAAETHAAEGRGGAEERTQLLLVGLSDGRQVGLPLDTVDRLEEFPSAKVERAGRYEVVQYRDGILPLIRLDEVFGAYGEGATDDLVQVVVCQRNGQLIGFVVTRILDIVDAELSVRSHLDTGGQRGSAVVAGRVTELVDVDTCIASVDPALLGASATSALGG